jgi:hypothetical protein
VLSPASTEDCAFENIGARTTAAQAALPKVHRVWLIVIQAKPLIEGKTSLREPCPGSRGFEGGSRRGGKSSPTVLSITAQALTILIGLPGLRAIRHGGAGR